MLMVIFGAGASYDALPSYPPGLSALENPYFDQQSRMPLADHLFENRANFVAVLNDYSECHPIVPNLRTRIPGKSVEQVLQGFLADSEQYPKRRQQLAAIRYYLQAMIYRTEEKCWAEGSGITNHIALLDQIQQCHKTEESVCLVTFNYDTLIERALRSIGIDFNALDSYINNNKYKLIKLHGSVTWGRMIIGPILSHDKKNIAHEVIRRIDEKEITLSQNYATVDNYPPEENSGAAWFPAIAIPVEKKENFECPLEHIAKMKEMIPHINKILMIGWRGTEQHFLHLLAEGLTHPVKGLIVAGGGKEAHETLVNIKQANIKGEFAPTSYGFTDIILNRSLEHFLNG